jgi:hypothetical protein
LEENTPQSRVDLNDPAQVRNLEAQLQGIRGSIDELGESLRHHAEQLPGHSSRILTEIADQAASSNAQEAVISGSEIAPRIRRAVSSEVERMVGLAQEVIRDIARRTGAIGYEFGRADSPEQSGVDSLIRDVPQFEMTPRIAEVPVDKPTALRHGLVRSRVRHVLMEQYREPLQESLENYSQTLQEWSRNLARELQQSVNSYVNAVSQNPDRRTLR